MKKNILKKDAEDKSPIFDGFILIFLLVILTIYYLDFLSPQLQRWNYFFLTIGAVIGTIPVLVSTLESFRSKKVSIDLLASVALVFSIMSQEWPSAVFINLMLTSARLLAMRTEKQARHALQGLLKLRPKYARIKKNDEITQVPVEEIKIGDFIMIELGETIPADGQVIEGQAEVNQSSITGESLPVLKTVGDTVLSSTTVAGGNLTVRADKIGKDTALEKIIDLIERSHENKPKMTTTADKFTSWYIIATFISAVLLYYYIGNTGLVLAILLVVCADDIAIAIPLAFLASLGHAAKRGAIIKGGNFIEALAKTKIIFADKTGTITYGRLKVKEFFSFDRQKTEETLFLAGSICMLSSHHVSKAILNYLEIKNIKEIEPDKFAEYSGKGAIALHEGKKIILGKPSFLESQGVIVNQENKKIIEAATGKGLSVTLIGLQNELLGLFGIADELRPKVKHTFEELRNLGIQKIIMLTGDNEKAARMVAHETGITEFHANLMPEDKVDYVKGAGSKEYKVVMIGDGVNDAASMNAADVSIAMGKTSSDITIEVGDIVLMQDDFSRLPELFRLAKKTKQVATQNFVIWGAVNVLGLILVFKGILSPTGAAAYNFLTDFVPILNSAKLFKAHLKS